MSCRPDSATFNQYWDNMMKSRFVISIKGQKKKKFLNRILAEIIAGTKVKKESIGRP